MILTRHALFLTRHALFLTLFAVVWILAAGSAATLSSLVPTAGGKNESTNSTSEEYHPADKLVSRAARAAAEVEGLAKHGHLLQYHLFGAVQGHRRLPTKNPCWQHERGDDARGKFCLPFFYILGPQKCGTTDTFERIMRHPEVVRLNPKQHEQLESHMLTNELENLVQQQPHAHRKDRFRSLYQHHAKNYHAHEAELLGNEYIVGDASADHMYRRVEPMVPTPLLLTAIQPDARLIAVLRDPVERTYSDFRFFFNCDVGKSGTLRVPPVRLRVKQ